MKGLSNRLCENFSRTLQSGGKLLIPYITACYPSPEATREILLRLADLGVGAVELGIPYSDPVADGPVIQTSFSRALAGGFRPAHAFELVRSIRDAIDTPLIAMVSYSIIYRTGLERFLDEAAEAGFDAILAPDLTLEEAPELLTQATRRNLAVPMLVAPTSSPQRRAAIADACTGFVYYISVTGTTGERDRLPDDLAEQVLDLRRFGKPVCVGFGISRPEHVAAVCAVGDGAIVGSALVRRLNDAADRGAGPSEVAESVAELVAQLKKGLPQ